MIQMDCHCSKCGISYTMYIPCRYKNTKQFERLKICACGSKMETKVKE